MIEKNKQTIKQMMKTVGITLLGIMGVVKSTTATLPTLVVSKIAPTQINRIFRKGLDKMHKRSQSALRWSAIRKAGRAAEQLEFLLMTK